MQQYTDWLTEGYETGFSKVIRIEKETKAKDSSWDSQSQRMKYFKFIKDWE